MGDIEPTTDEINVIEEDYSMSGFSKFSYKEIVLMQISRIAKMGSKEFRGGYWESSYDSKGNERRKYIADSNEEYSNAIKTLYILLKPDILKSKSKIIEEIKEVEKKFIKNIKDLKDEKGFLNDEESKITYSQELMLSSQTILEKILLFIKEEDYFGRKDIYH